MHEIAEGSGSVRLGGATGLAWSACRPDPAVCLGWPWPGHDRPARWAARRHTPAIVIEGFEMTGGPTWHLLMTKVRQERVAIVQLARQGYETFLPLARVEHGHRSVVEPLFPRYAFIRLLASRDDYAPIRSTIGVSRLVQFGGRYATVPSALVESLRSNGDSAGVCLQIDDRPVVGAQVQLLTGPFAGYEAEMRSRFGQDRVAVLLQIAGRQVEVELSASSIAATPR